MCGRATLTSPVEDIAEVFGVSQIPIGPPRFNIAPSQELAVVRLRRDTRERELALVRWGLVPWWSKDTKIANKCIQARAETIAKAPAFRSAFDKQRCLVVVDGFYEWSGTGKTRKPHHIRAAGGGVFAIAGVWESWKSPEGKVLETCAVVTTQAQGSLSALHHRMPLVLDGADRDRWLSATSAEAAGVVQDAAAALVIVPVSTWVNDVRHEDPRCVEPALAGE